MEIARAAELAAQLIGACLRDNGRAMSQQNIEIVGNPGGRRGPKPIGGRSRPMGWIRRQHGRA
ncbi:MAG: hypothetical protein ABSG95_05425 [Solirubrobacteraceae bacterium]